MSKMAIHYDPNGEWAALYVDSKLVIVGDKYRTEEEAFELLGVEVVSDDAFMRGQSAREGVAANLQEVTAYRRERDDRANQAQMLRTKAEELLAQAAALEVRERSKAREIPGVKSNDGPLGSRRGS